MNIVYFQLFENIYNSCWKSLSARFYIQRHLGRVSNGCLFSPEHGHTFLFFACLTLLLLLKTGQFWECIIATLDFYPSPRQGCFYCLFAFLFNNLPGINLLNLSFLQHVATKVSALFFFFFFLFLFLSLDTESLLYICLT